MILKLITPEAKDLRMDINADVLNNIVKDLGLFDIVITCNKLWFFT